MNLRILASQNNLAPASNQAACCALSKAERMSIWEAVRKTNTTGLEYAWKSCEDGSQTDYCEGDTKSCNYTKHCEGQSLTHFHTHPHNGDSYRLDALDSVFSTEDLKGSRWSAINHKQCVGYIGQDNQIYARCVMDRDVGTKLIEDNEKQEHSHLYGSEYTNAFRRVQDPKTCVVRIGPLAGDFPDDEAPPIIPGIKPPKIHRPAGTRGSVTLYQAIIQILNNRVTPGTPRQIYMGAVDQGLIPSVSVGKTPWNTIASIIYVDMKTKGEQSTFIKTEPGKFALRRYHTAPPSASLIERDPDRIFERHLANRGQAYVLEEKIRIKNRMDGLYKKRPEELRQILRSTSRVETGMGRVPKSWMISDILSSEFGEGWSKILEYNPVPGLPPEPILEPVHGVRCRNCNQEMSWLNTRERGKRGGWICPCGKREPYCKCARIS